MISSRRVTIVDKIEVGVDVRNNFVFGQRRDVSTVTKKAVNPSRPLKVKQLQNHSGRMALHIKSS